MRLNRSIQVEGAFAVLKEDMKLRKLKVRGKRSVLREIRIFCMGYNFNRYKKFDPRVIRQLSALIREDQSV